MYNGFKILAVIPARGGSKGLPGKNIKEYMGHPLITHTICQAKMSRHIDNLCVSTDCKNIKKASQQMGVEVIDRPKLYAEDNSPSSKAILHAIDYFTSKRAKLLNFDVVVMLECTSPLRTDEDIDNAIEMFIDNYGITDTLVCMAELSSDSEHPYCVKNVNKDGYLVPFMENSPPIYQRQQLCKAYGVYGGIYIAKVYQYIKNPTFYTDRTIGYLVERWQKFEIDDEIDFVCAEAIQKFKNKQQ